MFRSVVFEVIWIAGVICRIGGEDIGLIGVVDVRLYRVGGKERVKGGGIIKIFIVVKIFEVIEGFNYIF